MFLGLEKIFPPQNRHAEQSDARLKVRRHDQDGQRNTHDDDQEEDGMFGDDKASVSVESLIIFLENLIKSENQKKNEQLSFENWEINAENVKNDEKMIINPSNSVQKPQINMQKDAYAARATQMYASMASALENQGISRDTRPKAENLDAEIINSGDLRTIHKLLENLKLLSSHNIAMLDIQRGDSFLSSLVFAVEQRKSEFNL